MKTPDNSQNHSRLPNEDAPDASRNKNLRLLIAVVITLTIANFTVYLSGAFTNLDSGTFLIRSKWDILRDLDTPVEWLILGDSSANQGVVPAQFQTEYGGRSVNLGTVGNVLLIDDVWMFQNYINKHGAPSHVVIVHVYDMWAREASTSVFAHTPWDYMGDVGMFPTLKEKFELAWFRYVPLYQSSTQVFRALAAPTQMFSPPIAMANDGFTTASSPNPSAVKKDIESHSTGLLTDEFALSPTNDKAIDMLIQLADEHQIEVFIANSPLHEDLAELESFELYFRNIASLMSDIDDRSPNIHYVLQDTPTFDSTMMENVDHITFEGATVFTSKLITDIQTHLSK